MSAVDIVIRAEGLSKRFGGAQALSGLGLGVAAGEVFGYLGPNGAGTTTTIRLLLGMLRPTSGRAEIFGLDAHRDTVAAHRRLACVGGETSLWPARRCCACWAGCRVALTRRARPSRSSGSRSAGSQKVRGYSKGNRQKLALIAGLSSRADLLLLDEPRHRQPAISHTPTPGHPGRFCSLQTLRS